MRAAGRSRRDGQTEDLFGGEKLSLLAADEVDERLRGGRMAAAANEADRVVDHDGAASGKDVVELAALRPVDEDVRQIPERDQPFAPGETLGRGSRG